MSLVRSLFGIKNDPFTWNTATFERLLRFQKIGILYESLINSASVKCNYLSKIQADFPWKIVDLIILLSDSCCRVDSGFVEIALYLSDSRLPSTLSSCDSSLSYPCRDPSSSPLWLPFSLLPVSFKLGMSLLLFHDCVRLF